MNYEEQIEKGIDIDLVGLDPELQNMIAEVQETEELLTDLNDDWLGLQY